MNIGKIIRIYRESKGLTLKELGEKIGLTEQAVGNYERGERSPSIEILVKISNVLKVQLTQLLGIENIENKKTDITSFTTDELLKEIKRRIESEDK